MAVTVTWVGPLRDKTGGVKKLELESRSVAELLDELARRFGPEFDRLARHARIVLNGTAVQFIQGEQTPLAAGDEVAILMPLGGG